MDGGGTPGLASPLEQLAPGLDHLVVDEDVDVGEALAIDLAIHETSRVKVPGRPRLEVVEPDDVR